MSESPFLPGTNIQYAWDSTSLGYFKLCPRLYQYQMIEGWQSREDSVHLRFGIEYHAALQDYDLSLSAGIRHEDALHDVVQELMIRTADFDSDHKTKTRESLIRTVIWYLDKYKDTSETVYILPGGKAAVEQSFRFGLEWGPSAEQPYLLCGHLDKIVELNGDLYVKDYKTVWSFWNKSWEPDNQMTLYTIAGKIVVDSPIHGVIIDMAQIKEEETIFKRDITYRTPDQIEEWIGDLQYWFSLSEQYAIENYWPMNDMSCDKYGGCKFREICSKSPQVREQFLKASFKKQTEEERWNPLKPR